MENTAQQLWNLISSSTKITLKARRPVGGDKFVEFRFGDDNKKLMKLIREETESGIVYKIEAYKMPDREIITVSGNVGMNDVNRELKSVWEQCIK